MGSRLSDGRLSGGGDRTTGAAIRTCIGCRRREPADVLLRVVAGPEQPSDPAGSPARQVLPDPRHRAAGRGAWLHPVPDCVELAERRRAFARALRSGVRLDPEPVRRYVESLAAMQR